MNVETIECKHTFSNGTEFEFFQETQCAGCKRYRNDHCKVLNACYRAMWDKDAFPYSDLLDYKGYGGKKCKRRTTDPLTTHKRTRKQISGQMTLDCMIGD